MSPVKCYAILVCLLILYESEILAMRSFEFILSATECKCLSPKVSMNCTIRLGTDRKANNGFFLNIMAEDRVRKLIMDMVILVDRYRTSGLVIMNTTNVDGCMFLEDRNAFHILHIIRNALAAYSNFPKKCPLKKGTRIEVRNLTLDAELFPPYIPMGNFSVQTLVREGKTKLFRLVVNGSVTSRVRVANEIKGRL